MLLLANSIIWFNVLYTHAALLNNNNVNQTNVYCSLRFVGAIDTMSREIQTVLLDLDDCLYQIEAIPHLMLQRIQGAQESNTLTNTHLPSAEYMKIKLGIPAESIDSLSSQFYMNFGTTLAGLVVRSNQLGCATCTTRTYTGQRTHNRL